ncbi:MAG: alpha/beta hydrolase [Rhizobiales bacterium]|jgi:phospholipase/carboxylesterase|nr:alpha/beta hydrolase [Hyphomicrobiales bacterium]MBP9173518.1 alpha/beta hydrolase [Hyphomicrobiales bacterium]
MTQDLSFIHRFEPGTSTAAPLLLLHGTGGDETDLLPLGKALAPDRALLSPRGKVLENGMPRYFHRLAEGMFDEQDVIKRANELADFIVEAGKAYGLPKPVAVGFSNGANIAAAILLLRPEALSGAILLRAMVPLAKPPQAALAQTPVLIVSGASDPIIPASNAKRLATMLKDANADVTHETLPTGHNLTQNDVTIATKWLNR